MTACLGLTFGAFSDPQPGGGGVLRARKSLMRRQVGAIARDLFGELGLDLVVKIQL